MHNDLLQRKHENMCNLKGALDKYNIYLFISNSMENFKTIPKFSADFTNAFSFYGVFSEQHHLQNVQ